MSSEWTPTRDRVDLVERMVPLVASAFSDDGPVSRGRFLRTLWEPPHVEGLHDTFAAVAANNPEATHEEVREALREDALAFYLKVADGAGLDRMERASLLAAVRKGFDLAQHEHEHEHEKGRADG